jgi:hypothetical protein
MSFYKPFNEISASTSKLFRTKKSLYDTAQAFQ